MQSRVEAHDSLDDFPTPPWATRALCEKLLAHGEDLARQHAWEPACNRGYMAAPLGEYFAGLHATDVHDYGWAGQDWVADFLIDWGQDVPVVDWVITNPPFRLAADFVAQGLKVARRGVAVFLRTAFLEGVERYETLFAPTPERWVMPFVERVVLWRGVLLDPDVKILNPSTGKIEKPTTATSYTWMVWVKGYAGLPELDRIGPCRGTLTRPGDYPPVPEHLRPPMDDGGLL